MKKSIILLAVLIIVTAIFATTMTVHTTNGDVDFEISEIESITFGNPDLQIPTDYIAYYSFQNDSQDETGNYNGAATDNVNFNVSDRFSNQNSAIELNGSDAYIQVENNYEDLTNATWSIWLNPTVSNEYQAICSKWNGSGGTGWLVSIENEQYAIETPNNQYYFQTGNVSLNTWTHLVISCDNEYVKFYIDGQLENTLEQVSPINNNGTSSQIGKNNHPVNGFFNGKLDDIRIYNRALSDEEVQALYHENGWN